MMNGWTLLCLSCHIKAAVPAPLSQVNDIPYDGLGEHRDCVCPGYPGISDQECSFFTLDRGESMQV